MKRHSRLSAFLSLLLGTFGAFASAGACRSRWLSTVSPTEASISQSIPLAQRMHLPYARSLVALADLRPEREEEYLKAAVRADERQLLALLRLSLLAEFSHQPAQALAYMDRAVGYHHTYRTYVAAAGQAARIGNTARLEQFARLTIRYCPRDADDLYELIPTLSLAQRVLDGSNAERKVDYLRFLIGRQRTEDAVLYETSLPDTAHVHRLRLELSEQLLSMGKRDLAAGLFGKLCPEFANKGRCNESLLTEPAGLGFDWRLSQNEKIRREWRPGQLEFEIAESVVPMEVLSIFVREQERKLDAQWSGEIRGLAWQMEVVGDGVQRYSLTAGAGPARRFVFEGMRPK